MKKQSKNLFVLLMLAVLLPVCGKYGGGGGLTQDQLDAIGEAFAFSALSSAGGAVSPTSIPLLNNFALTPLVNCTPDTLTPPYNCPAGGNIYFTINLSCSGPSGCCAQQNLCKKDTMSINGMGSTLYNSCAIRSKAGDSVVINGTITATLTSTAEISCPSIVTVDVKITLTGMPSITVNGREVCKGDIFLTATAHYGGSIYTTISGTVCGQSIYNTYNYGCAVKCPDGSCCPNGSYCGTCTPDACFSIAYPVDCCNGYACLQGTKCVQVGGETKCQW